MDKRHSIKIHFHFVFQPFTLRNREGLKCFIEDIFNKEKKAIESVNFIFCNNMEIKKLNKEYLNHNYSTDILTFDFSVKGKAILSDVFISQEQVKLNAKEFDTSFTKEIHRVIFHGVLHLCGYNDKTSTDKALMRDKEHYYLDKYFPDSRRST
ncbi:MAG TPA: rRNA maturation RNase YbeY [Puia sp.]|jgi:probable rRNA maturation factor|nr:rRNA maturation RNase YbeY [Puia sp.]